MIELLSSHEKETNKVRFILHVAQHIADEANDGTVDGGSGYIPCCLRYQLRLQNGKIARHTFLRRKDPLEGYLDDDRHGRLTSAGFGGDQAKDDLESFLRPWFEEHYLPPPDPVAKDLQVWGSAIGKNQGWGNAMGGNVLGSNPWRPPNTIPVGKTSERFYWGAQEAKSYAKLDEVLSKLLPSDLLPQILGLSLLVDIYLNRTVVGWHKDWNDAHALVVGLLNISDRPLGSTEFVHDPESFWDEAHREVMSKRPTSPLRIAIREAAYKAYQPHAVVHKTMETHAEGTMRWFNDVVWIHRTPPDGSRPDGARLTKEVDDSIYGIDGFAYRFSKYVKPVLTDPAKYSTQPLEPRMLMRVTLRDLYRG